MCPLAAKNFFQVNLKPLVDAPVKTKYGFPGYQQRPLATAKNVLSYETYMVETAIDQIGSQFFQAVDHRLLRRKLKGTLRTRPYRCSAVDITSEGRTNSSRFKYRRLIVH